MLPTDLLMFRQNGEQIIPKRLNIDKFHLKLAIDLIECYKKAANERYGELERRLSEMEGDNTDYKIKRGLADRKSTRLNSSHQIISYAVFCLKKKKQKKKNTNNTHTTQKPTRRDESQ